MTSFAVPVDTLLVIDIEFNVLIAYLVFTDRTGGG
jgi:hypothetical protein